MQEHHKVMTTHQKGGKHDSHMVIMRKRERRVPIKTSAAHGHRHSSHETNKDENNNNNNYYYFYYYYCCCCYYYYYYYYHHDSSVLQFGQFCRFWRPSMVRRWESCSRCPKKYGTSTLIMYLSNSKLLSSANSGQIVFVQSSLVFWSSLLDIACSCHSMWRHRVV